jgi:hypothetical protein
MSAWRESMTASTRGPMRLGEARRRPSAACERCGTHQREVRASCAAGGKVCLDCYLPAAGSEYDRRVAHQRKAAAAIRDAAERIDGARRQMLADRAFLIEIADSAGEVRALLGEVERLGVKVRRRGA